MTQINSLILPSTIPDVSTIRQLLLFSDSVFQFAPCEDSVDQALFTEFGGRYIHYPPVPFGKGLGGFQKFIKDLTSHRSEYYSGGLSQLSTNQSTDIDEASVWQLVDKLAQSTSSNTSETEALVHARVLLKLAEIQNSEEDDISQALSSIDEHIGQVFTELKDENDNTMSDILSGSQQTKKADHHKLLKAWLLLYLANQNAHQYHLIATDEETFATLSEYSTSLLVPPNSKLCSVSVPSFTEDPGVPWSQFKQSNSETIKSFQNFLENAAAGNITDKIGINTFGKAIDETFGNNLPQTNLTFYTLPLSLLEIAEKITRTQSRESDTNSQQNTLVAVYSSHG